MRKTHNWPCLQFKVSCQQFYTHLLQWWPKGKIIFGLQGTFCYNTAMGHWEKYEARLRCSPGPDLHTLRWYRAGWKSPGVVVSFYTVICTLGFTFYLYIFNQFSLLSDTIHVSYRCILSVCFSLSLSLFYIFLKHLFIFLQGSQFDNAGPMLAPTSWQTTRKEAGLSEESIEHFWQVVTFK